jgi:hypothetical protein
MRGFFALSQLTAAMSSEHQALPAKAKPLLVTKSRCNLLSHGILEPQCSPEVGSTVKSSEPRASMTCHHLLSCPPASPPSTTAAHPAHAPSHAAATHALHGAEDLRQDGFLISLLLFHALDAAHEHLARRGLFTA